MTKFAEGTEVSIEKSQSEIRQTVKNRYGATELSIKEGEHVSGVEFTFKGRNVRIMMNMPSVNDAKFLKTPGGNKRTKEQIVSAWDKECRRIWRALNLVVKAKLEMVENGASFDAEFMAYLVCGDNRTVADHSLTMISEALDTGRPLGLPTRKESA